MEAASLRRLCRPADIPFETTAEAPPVGHIVGQERAAQALRFGIGMGRPGYNLFVVGSPGVGKQTLLQQFLGERAAHQATPNDWCYVNNFADRARPRALELPPGQGARLQQDMARAVEDLQDALRAVFDSEEYRTRKQQIFDRLKKRQQEAIAEVRERARRRGVAVLETPGGIGLAPLRGGSPMPPEAFQALPQSERDERQAEMNRVGDELQEVLRRFHDWGKQHQEELKRLDREMAASAADDALGELRDRYADMPVVLEHIAHLERDVVERAHQFLELSAEGGEAELKRALARERRDEPSFDRYQINLLVDHRGGDGAPVVREDNPTYTNLIGRMEHEAQFGALTTNFRLLKGGALHRAIGGYLIVDALKLLQHPFAWDALKRTLQAGEIHIESPDQALGLFPVASLKPQAVPLGRTKVVLTGERWLYYLLAQMDPEFSELFKVLVDFEERMDRRDESQATYANLVASLVAKEGLRAFDRGAVARVIDQAARAAGDSEKLSVHMRSIVDLLRETEHWAAEEGRDIATARDVQRAIDAQRFRGGRVREQLREAMRREDLLVSTDGERVGQVNGLSVISLGEQRVGHPTRITARARVGKGELIDIEREVALAGPIHSKGVLILSGLLGSRYAATLPLSLSATLVFEQSYGPVEGDSASLAELCALLSALADVPVRQWLAITGSVNQQGDVQSVGGVNEKIEGFFDLCQERGLSGDQGVLIPRTNAKNLMLRPDVVQAAEERRFHVWAVERVDDALEILAGRPAGARDAEGRFPDGTVNALVESRLLSFAESARQFATGRGERPR